MQELEKILEEIESLSREHPYRILGIPDTYSQYNEAWQDCIDRVEEIIRKHMTDGWIPVEERMPTKEEFLKDDGRFILDDGNRRYQGLFDIYDGKFKFSRHISGIHYELFEDKCVIAWHPLPDPYKKIQEENK